MRLLVTNDDGIEAAGLHALAAALADAGHEVVVAAPLLEMSGSGAAIGIMSLDEELLVSQAEIPGRPDIETYAIDGPPALAVLAARLGAFGDAPDLVASGINPGHNTGRAMLHSGTVGAALTAGNFGVSALAVSTGTGPDPAWRTACELAVGAVDWLLGEPNKTVINLNVPDVSLAGTARRSVGRARRVRDGPGHAGRDRRPPPEDDAAGNRGRASSRDGHGTRQCRVCGGHDHQRGDVG